MKRSPDYDDNTTKRVRNEDILSVDQYASAFVLPLRKADDGLQALLLFETRSKKTLLGLMGGKKEEEKDIDSKDTAIRELREESNGYVNDEFLSRMKDGSIELIHSYYERGKCVVYAFMIDATDLDDDKQRQEHEWVDFKCVCNNDWRKDKMHFHAAVLCARVSKEFEKQRGTFKKSSQNL